MPRVLLSVSRCCVCRGPGRELICTVNQQVLITRPPAPAPRLPQSFDITRSGSHLIAKMSSFLKKNPGIKKVTLREGKRSPPYFLNHSGLGRELSSGPGRAASHHPHGLCLVGGPPRLFLATGNLGSCLQLDTLRVPDRVAFRKAGFIYGAGTTGHAPCHCDTEAFLPRPQSTPLPRLQAASVTHRETHGPTAPASGAGKGKAQPKVPQFPP